ncbi:MAG: hypothetical protein AMXMBFR44_6810 [Candidatus Campbellbacteria bacterium]
MIKVDTKKGEFISANEIGRVKLKTSDAIYVESGSVRGVKNEVLVFITELQPHSASPSLNDTEVFVEHRTNGMCTRVRIP